ncbi:MAG: ATPase [Candidatus Thorarchaeota archaeon]|nr:ATPase [Candidatus Thorarchaeota archaeon]
MQVKKRNGTLEAFMPEKIVVSCVKSGCPYDTARTIAKTISKSKEKVVDTSIIRERVLSELTARGQTEAVAHWRSYDQEKSRE